jgi:hypothetical protein
MSNDIHRAVVAADQDAQTDVSKLQWIIVGFVGNIIGILIATIYQPTPPATRLFENSQEYIAFYTDTYIIKARSIQRIYAAVGCCIPFVLMFLFRILLSGYLND